MKDCDRCDFFRRNELGQCLGCGKTLEPIRSFFYDLYYRTVGGCYYRNRRKFNMGIQSVSKLIKRRKV